MSKTVVLVAGILVAAGAVAAVSAPGLLDDLVEGVSEATHRVTQAVGTSDDEDRKSRRASRHREDGKAQDDTETAQDAGDKPRRERHAKGKRRQESAEDGGKERERGRQQAAARQEDNDNADASEERREVRSTGYSREEWRGEARRRGSSSAEDQADQYFRRADKNSDGAIDASEFVVAEAERIASKAQQFLKRLDADGDGKVTREEFESGARERIAARDRDDHAADGGSKAARKPAAVK